jgi:hypothetical protein
MKTRCIFEMTVANNDQQEYFIVFLQRFRKTLRPNQVVRVEVSAEDEPPPPPIPDDFK